MADLKVKYGVDERKSIASVHEIDYAADKALDEGKAVNFFEKITSNPTSGCSAQVVRQLDDVSRTFTWDYAGKFYAS